ncbi:MAG: choice-of-anchor J domain-containing protein [Bacteroidetes bacterium]|nr:choice-of-anchor J domain-containing protein [Bacteroidota bacterium]MCL2302479.1 choice-of-anchor J domain-containing protein [Lentimicrobiaceae bacterium]
MKKMLFVLGLFLSCAFLYAQQASLTDMAQPTHKQTVLKQASTGDVVYPNSARLQANPHSATEKAEAILSAARSQQSAPASKNVIFSEGFESGSEPAGWFFWKSGSGRAWEMVDGLYNGSVQVVWPNSGNYFATNLWAQNAGPRNAWMISTGFTLTAGTQYTISFYLGLAGFQNERDKLKVCLGNAQTVAGMEAGTTLYNNPGTSAVPTWTKMEFTYTPTTTGTFYLGFHAFSDYNWGNDINIDDILITGGGTNPTDCDPATNLNVTYATDCSKATLTWNAPTKSRNTVLWDNTNIHGSLTTSGYHSVVWSDGDIVQADDFDVTESWKITQITSRSFVNAGTGGIPPAANPTSFGIKFYADNGGKPGTELYSKTIAGGAAVVGDPFTVTLPEAFEIHTAGKYWVSIYGIYTTAGATNNVYRVYIGDIEKGASVHIKGSLLDGYTDWVIPGTYAPGLAPMKSMNFLLRGEILSTNPGDYAYNVYRNDVKIAGPISTTTYDDLTFTSTEAYTWKVTVVCEEGGESAPATKAMEPCEIEAGDCNSPTNLVVTYADACSKANLTWSAPSAKSGIFDGAEDHPNFAQNSPGTVGWTYYENGSPTYGFQNYEFPGDYENFAYIVFNPSATFPSMAGEADIQPRTGQKFFGCFATVPPSQGGIQPNNHWMVSPQLNADGEFTFSFWAKTFTSLYPLERMRVRYSTTNNAQASFTNYLAGSATTHVTVPATWTQYTYTVPANAKYVAIQCVSNDAFVFMVDDITINVGGSTTNYTYNVYRDGVQIGTSTTTSYTDTDFDPTVGHTWSVRVACEEGGVSAPASKTMDPCDNLECLPATGVTANHVAGGIRVCWTLPAAKPEITITQSNNPGTGVIGSSGSLSFGVYNRFRPEDLVAVNGGELTKFVFIPGMGDTQGGIPRHNYTIRIYKGGTWGPNASDRSLGTLIFSQALDNDQLDFDSGDDNIIILNEPVIIDATQELWIGYWCQATSPGGYPALTDVGPRKSGLGDVMHYNGLTTLYDVLPSSPYNWYMQGKVQLSIPTVNIYFNDTKIASAIEGTCWQHSNPPSPANVPYPWCYQVEVNCVNGSTSPKTECYDYVSINEAVKTGFSIAPNPATNSITISADNNFHTIEIVSFLGQTVVAQPNAGNAATLDVSNLTNGVYFVRIISENGTSVKKFVKQ